LDWLARITGTDRLSHHDNARGFTECEGHPAVVVLSHPIKNASRSNLLPRGGGAFLNELDGNLTLWSDNLGEVTELHWQGMPKPDMHCTAMPACGRWARAVASCGR
jgi:hypothetical protein